MRLILNQSKCFHRSSQVGLVLFLGMAPLYETLTASSVLELDQSLLDSMRATNEEELKKLDEK